jgi:hypothetical protein
MRFSLLWTWSCCPSGLWCRENSTLQTWRCAPNSNVSPRHWYLGTNLYGIVIQTNILKFNASERRRFSKETYARSVYPTGNSFFYIPHGISLCNLNTLDVGCTFIHCTWKSKKEALLFVSCLTPTWLGNTWLSTFRFTYVSFQQEYKCVNK